MSTFADNGRLLRELNAISDPIGGLAIFSAEFGATTGSAYLTWRNPCDRPNELRDM
jgi:hypothetical protein